MSDAVIDHPILNAPFAESFDPPETGRIAVKVINHYGDEVLETYEVEPA